MFEPVGDEVAERVRIVLRLGNAPKRAQAPGEVKDIDGLIERGLESGNGITPEERGLRSETQLS